MIKSSTHACYGSDVSIQLYQGHKGSANAYEILRTIHPGTGDRCDENYANCGEFVFDKQQRRIRGESQ